MILNNYNTENMFEYENGFYATSTELRFGKFIAHYELYKKIIGLPGAVIECGLFKGNSFFRLAHFRDLLESNTLNFLAKKAGFEVEFIKHIQRYPLSNHLYWLSFNKPGGHEKWEGFLDSKELNLAYENQLAALGTTDTLIACLKKDIE